MDRVDDLLFISDWITANDCSVLDRGNIKRIVKLFEDEPPGWHAHDGVKYLVTPTLDDPSYDIDEDARNAIMFIREGIANNERILVHCRAGVSRSATIIILHLMINHGMPARVAFDYLKKIRPMINPNRGFRSYIAKVENRIRDMFTTHPFQ